MLENVGCRSRCATGPSPWVMRWAHLVKPGARVLDVAAGEGRHSAFFALKGACVTAVDRDVRFLSDLAQAPGMAIEARDLEADPWPYAPGSFDAIVVTNYLWRAHFPLYARTLAPGGVLIFETFTEYNKTIWGRPANPAHALREGELLEAFAPLGLEMVAYESGLTALPAAVARIVCRKPDGPDPRPVPLSP